MQTQSYYQLENWKNHLERLLTEFPKLVQKEETDSKNNNRRTTRQRRREESDMKSLDTDTNAIFMELYKEININKINVATKLAIEEKLKKEEKTDEELIPEEYHEYLDVFSEEKAA